MNDDTGWFWGMLSVTCWMLWLGIVVLGRAPIIGLTALGTSSLGFVFLGIMISEEI